MHARWDLRLTSNKALMPAAAAQGREHGEGGGYIEPGVGPGDCLFHRMSALFYFVLFTPCIVFALLFLSSSSVVLQIRGH